LAAPATRPRLHLRWSCILESGPPKSSVNLVHQESSSLFFFLVFFFFFWSSRRDKAKQFLSPDVLLLARHSAGRSKFPRLTSRTGGGGGGGGHVSPGWWTREPTDWAEWMSEGGEMEERGDGDESGNFDG
jgi:hypothetical protein